MISSSIKWFLTISLGLWFFSIAESYGQPSCFAGKTYEVHVVCSIPGVSCSTETCSISFENDGRNLTLSGCSFAEGCTVEVVGIQKAKTTSIWHIIARVECVTEPGVSKLGLLKLATGGCGTSSCGKITGTFKNVIPSHPKTQCNLLGAEVVE